MAADHCVVCGAKVSIFKSKVKDGYICASCLNQLPPRTYNDKENLTGAEIGAVIESVKKPEPQKRSIFEAPAESKMTDFDRIREYKKLLDEGIITEEEFERKKREILKL